MFLASGTVGAKAVVKRSFDPAPPATFYASVWAEVESTMTLEFGEDFAPVGQVETVFMENAESEPGMIMVVAQQVGPVTWQARFTLPRAGIWNGRHNYQAVGPDGTVSRAGDDFALQAVQRMPARSIVVTRDDTLSPGCQPREVADLVVRFFEAFNRSDRVQLARFFGPQFRWYSVTESDPSQGGHHFVAFHPSDALAYFAERHQHGEQLDLLALDVAASGDIAYVVARHADDLPPGPGGAEWTVLGKGRIDCRAQTIDVWSIGMDLSGEPATALSLQLCPEPRVATPTDPAVACSRAAR